MSRLYKKTAVRREIKKKLGKIKNNKNWKKCNKKFQNKINLNWIKENIGKPKIEIKKL